MPAGYKHRSGAWEGDKQLTTASTALAVLDGLKHTTGKLALATTGAKFDGVSHGTKAVGDSLTTAINYARVLAGETHLEAYEKGTTSLAATDEGALVDLIGASGAMGFDSNASTNDDFYVHTVEVADSSTASEPGRAVILPADPAYLGATQ